MAEKTYTIKGELDLLGNLENHTAEEIKEILQNNPRVLQYVDPLDEEVSMIALSENPRILRDIKRELSTTAYENAVWLEPSVFRYVPNKKITETMIKVAVDDDHKNLQYVKEVTDDLLRDFLLPNYNHQEVLDNLAEFPPVFAEFDKLQSRTSVGLLEFYLKGYSVEDMIIHLLDNNSIFLEDVPAKYLTRELSEKYSKPAVEITDIWI